MAVLSPIALNNRIVGLENLVAGHSVRAQNAHEENLTAIHAVVAEAERLSEAVVELDKRCERNRSLYQALHEARVEESEKLNQMLDNLANCIGSLDERIDQRVSRVDRQIAEVRTHAETLVHDLEVDVGSVASDLADLRGELLG